MINVPQALSPLADTPLWVCFALVEDKQKHGGAGGYDKPPVSPHSLRMARINVPQDLGVFEQAAARVGQSVTIKDKKSGQFIPAHVSGVGLVLKDSGLFCLDLDEVRNKETGELTPEAGEIVRLLSPVAYIEVSVSGKGLHCVMFGAAPQGVGRGRYPGKADALGGTAAEYQFLENGFITVSGEALPGCASELSDPSGPLGEVIRRFFTAPAQAQEQGVLSVDSSGSAIPAAPQVSAAPSTGNRALSPSLPSVADLWEERAPLMSDGEFMQAV